jgi:hypothetical protein
MDPLQTINQYADILLKKITNRPEITNLLEAIKYCNRMIQFSIMDLQDISSITDERFKII